MAGTVGGQDYKSPRDLTRGNQPSKSSSRREFFHGAMRHNERLSHRFEGAEVVTTGNPGDGADSTGHSDEGHPSEDDPK